MLAEPPLECCVERLARVDNLILPVEGIDTLFRRGHILRERMGGASLKLLDELAGKSLVEFEEKAVFVAHLWSRE